MKELAITVEDVIMVFYVRFRCPAMKYTNVQTASRKLVTNWFSADE